LGFFERLEDWVVVELWCVFLSLDGGSCSILNPLLHVLKMLDASPCST
jgi:hypothetical protein